MSGPDGPLADAAEAGRPGGDPGPRVPLLGFAEAGRAGTAAGIDRGVAELNVFRAWLHQPVAARHSADLIMGLLGEGPLDTRLRELIIMRIGWVTGSCYEWTQHWRIARVLGVAEADLLGVRDWRAHDGFGPAERAVLAAVDETVAGHPITDDTWAACVAHVSDDPAVLVDLVTAIGCWHLVSGVLRTLRIPLEDGVEPWPPDGLVPASAQDEAAPTPAPPTPPTDEEHRP